MEYSTNSKAGFDFEILETLEAGLVLTGTEVRSIRTGKVSIKGAYVKIINAQAYLLGAVIPPYQPGNTPKDYDEQANRKLLLSKRQINDLISKGQSLGLALVPLKIYDKRGHLKLLVGIAKGKKKYDKRETIKKKDLKRSKERGNEE